MENVNPAITLTEADKIQLAQRFQKHPNNYQPNVITESRQEFTELEKKIVILVINQLGDMIFNDLVPSGNIEFMIPYSVLTVKNHKEIAKAAESLQSKRQGYKTVDAQGRIKFHYRTPFPEIRNEFIGVKSYLHITMLQSAVPHYIELGKRYTKYDCQVMLSLGSVYSQRIYEIIMMFVNRGQHTFDYDVKELRYIINYREDHTYNDFKKNALWRAQKELEQKANLIFDFEPSDKIGKQITKLRFTVKTTRDLAAEAVEQDRRIINQMPIHEAVQTAWRLMNEYKLKDWQKDMIASDHALLEIFYRVHVEVTNGLRPDIKNRTAYLVKSLGIDQVKQPKSAKAKTPAMPSFLAPAPLAAVGRSSAPQSIGSILDEILSTNK